MSNNSCFQPELMSFNSALRRLLEKVSRPEKTESLDLFTALDRVLAENISSPINVPGFDNSAMDGYALRAEDLKDSEYLKLMGKSMAGTPFDGRIEAGQCVRIMTGAVVPNGANCVVMQEKTSQQGVAELGEVIHFQASPAVGDNIRRAGDDISQGQTVLHSGKKLSPADIGLLASLGLAEVPVFPKIKVAMFSTGDEIQQPGQPLKASQIYDSNRYTCCSLLTKLNVEIRDLGVIKDDPTLVRRALLEADEWADVVITSGGVSVGEADYLKPLIEELGKLELWKIAIKPGKPFAYGVLPNAHFIGLPGNPVSALVTLHQLAVPMLKKLQGLSDSEPKLLKAILQDDLKKHPGRKELQRGLVSVNSEGHLCVRSTGKQGSGILTSMVNANCFIHLDEACNGVAAGESVDVELFDELLK